MKGIAASKIIIRGERGKVKGERVKTIRDLKEAVERAEEIELMIFAMHLNGTIREEDVCCYNFLMCAINQACEAINKEVKVWEKKEG